MTWRTLFYEMLSFLSDRKHFPAVGIDIEQCFGYRGNLGFKRPYVKG